MNNINTKYRGLPPDLWPRRVFQGVGGQRGAPNLENMDRNTPPPYLGEAIYVGRGFQGLIANITNVPSLILTSQYSWPYMILNPSRSVGLTSSGTIITSTTTALAGNTQLTPLGVANYMYMQLFFEITAVTGTWDFIAQVLNPATNTWFDSQYLITGAVAPINQYVNIGMLGLATDFAVRWVPTAPGSITFSIGYTLKEGTVGSATGLAQTIYIGSNPGISVVSAFPILEGDKEIFVVGEGVELWGVSESDVTARIFML